MPMRKFKKRVYKKKAVRKSYPISRGLSGVPEKASLTEQVGLSTTGQGIYNTNQSYVLYNASLALTSRARLVAQAYQEYRIRRVSLVWKAGPDTFNISGAAATSTSVPQLYYLVDRKMAVPSAFDFVTLQQSGALPKRFDDKNVKATFAPAVLQSSISDPGALTTALAASNISPWLPTNSTPQDNTNNVSDVDHTGIVWYVRQSATGGFPSGRTTYDVDIMFDIEFRKPRLTIARSPLPPVATAVFGVDPLVVQG